MLPNPFHPPFPSRKDGSVDEIRDLARWIQELPKPIALIAAFDQRALHVLEAVDLCGLNMPRDVSVIGFDSDILLCEFAKPPLSSVQIDHVRIGEIMARELAKLIDERKTSRVRTIKTKDIRIVERESAKPVTPSVKLVESAIDYIDRNASKGIKVTDVANHLRVSRSLLDLRFRQCTDTSVNAAILERKFNAIKRLLDETSTPISRITASCGFKSENSIKNLFRRRFGCSMSEWRGRA